MARARSSPAPCAPTRRGPLLAFGARLGRGPARTSTSLPRAAPRPLDLHRLDLRAEFSAARCERKKKRTNPVRDVGSANSPPPSPPPSGGRLVLPLPLPPALDPRSRALRDTRVGDAQVDVAALLVRHTTSFRRACASSPSPPRSPAALPHGPPPPVPACPAPPFPLRLRRRHPISFPPSVCLFHPLVPSFHL